MKVFIGINEASAEHILLKIMDVISKTKPEAKFYLQAQETTLDKVSGKIQVERVFDSSLCAVMGIIEPLKILPKLLRRKKDIKQWIEENKPDLFIGIDGPDFWLPLERFARDRGIYAVHIVSPSVWAWRMGRVKTIEKSVHELYTLFDFEWKYYQDLNLKLRTFPHPLIDRYYQSMCELLKQQKKSVPLAGHLVCVPGSRKSEIINHLEIFLKVALKFVKQGRFPFIIIPAIPEHRDLIENIVSDKFLSDKSSIKIVDNMSDALQGAKLAFCVSGTATLECAVFKVPTVVCYKIASWKKYLLSFIIKTPYICLVNIIKGDLLFPEIIGSCSEIEKRLTQETDLWLNDSQAYDRVLLGLQQIIGSLLETREKKCLDSQISQTIQQVLMRQEEVHLQDQS